MYSFILYAAAFLTMGLAYNLVGKQIIKEDDLAIDKDKIEN
ncbi:MAG: hypothetical protein WCD89_24425 [Anaerocolumna sp.]